MSEDPHPEIHYFICRIINRSEFDGFHVPIKFELHTNERSGVAFRFSNVQVVVVFEIIIKTGIRFCHGPPKS